LKPPPELLEALAQDTGERLVGPWRTRPLRADGALLGVAAWRGPAEQEVAPEDDPLVAVLTDLGAAAVMRARLAAARSEIEAMARTQQLRNALLSSISHDLRTPLAAILASASSLKDFGERFSPDVRADLVTTIQEEAIRLNRFVANLLSMTRLESGALDLDRQTFAVLEVIDRVAVRFERPERPIRRAMTDVGLLASGDPILLEQALGNVVENAIRYGPEGAAVTLRAWRDDGAVRIEVEDEGRGVPAPDLDRIFEKFYRSPGAAMVQGTGLGLSIARGLVEAMDGAITARARDDGQPGLVVSLILTESTPHAA
jgi:K+-sensing histidine kinase KdpD